MRAMHRAERAPRAGRSGHARPTRCAAQRAAGRRRRGLPGRAGRARADRRQRRLLRPHREGQGDPALADPDQRPRSRMRSYEAPADVESFLDEAEHQIFAISERKARPSFFRVRDIVVESMKAVEQLYERKELVTGVPTGFDDLDTQDRRPAAGRPGHRRRPPEHGQDRVRAQHRAVRRAGRARPAWRSSRSRCRRSSSCCRMLCSEARVDQSKVRAGFAARARLSEARDRRRAARPRRRSTSTTRRRSACSSCAPRRAA